MFMLFSIYNELSPSTLGVLDVLPVYQARSGSDPASASCRSLAAKALCPEGLMMEGCQRFIIAEEERRNAV